MTLIRFSNGVYVNIEKVSSIKILEKRLILNMNYTIFKNGSYIPDYVYVDDYNEHDVKAIETNPYVIGRFIISGNILINSDSISNIKVNGDRSIINMTNAHTYNLNIGKNDEVRTKKAVMAEYITVDTSVIAKILPKE